ncbi:hypothetical protein [Avibacterium paragallinarum]|uniref:hypothetical protein n=1 Tax=Avibacterium paragallinarum TaxID=728 RepID=UPI001C994B66|nr:hypothetical protein [Avibacterium paragallinarum]QZP15797.1 hypothetical protein K5O18_13925 [Avibacterium paragallinarum]
MSKPTLTISHFPQWKRQGELIKQANRKCFEQFPDDFHHKIQMKKEGQVLLDGLAQGRELLLELINSQELNSAQQAKNKAFKRSSKFLIGLLMGVIADVEALESERMEAEKLAEGNK